MITFLVGICILIFGYFFWSKVAEKIFGPDDRKTPALNHPDAVERVPLSTRRNLLIQLLNIAGMGPVVGVVLGMKFGAIVFLLLPIGNVIGGAVHDYYVGMISARNNGFDMTSLVNKFFGRNVGGLFIVLVILSLLLLVTTFTNIPANFIQLLLPFGVPVLICAVIGIFVYYIISTIFPIDKVVGRIYPIFGVALIVVTALLCIAYIPFASDIPDIVLTPAGIAAAFTAHPNGQPIIPMLFITIACGILSGFHATQSPITSRTITSEREGRKVFYGMMIAEGIIAMIWAAGASIIFTLKPEMLASTNGNAIIFEILNMVFPTFLIVLAITSGDTALRVIRTSVAGPLRIRSVDDEKTHPSGSSVGCRDYHASVLVKSDPDRVCDPLELLFLVQSGHRLVCFDDVDGVSDQQRKTVLDIDDFGCWYSVYRDLVYFMGKPGTPRRSAVWDRHAS